MTDCHGLKMTPADGRQRTLHAERQRLATGLLEVRRVPLKFVPPGALVTPREAIGLAPLAKLPPAAKRRPSATV